MLTGTLPQQIHAPTAPWYHRPAATRCDDIAIIGGGIVSALTALALQRRGAVVTLYCADAQPAQGASGNRQGALYPLLNGKMMHWKPFLPVPLPLPAVSTTNCLSKGSPLTISGAVSAN